MRQAESDQERLYRLAREFERSGETRADYSRRVGIAPATLDHYRRRSGEATGAVRWVEVEPATPLARPGGVDLVLVLGEGLRIELGSGFDPSALTRLLKVLER